MSLNVINIRTAGWDNKLRWQQMLIGNNLKF